MELKNRRAPAVNMSIFFSKSGAIDFVVATAFIFPFVLQYGVE